MRVSINKNYLHYGRKVHATVLFQLSIFDLPGRSTPAEAHYHYHESRRLAGGVQGTVVYSNRSISDLPYSMDTVTTVCSLRYNAQTTWTTLWTRSTDWSRVTSFESCQTFEDPTSSIFGCDLWSFGIIFDLWSLSQVWRRPCTCTPQATGLYEWVDHTPSHFYTLSRTLQSILLPYSDNERTSSRFSWRPRSPSPFLPPPTSTIPSHTRYPVAARVL